MAMSSTTGVLGSASDDGIMSSTHEASGVNTGDGTMSAEKTADTKGMEENNAR
jgi:hypothetical protein